MSEAGHRANPDAVAVAECRLEAWRKEEESEGSIAEVPRLSDADPAPTVRSGDANVRDRNIVPSAGSIDGLP